MIRSVTSEPRQWLQSVLTIPGVVGFFLPFTSDTSPYGAATATAGFSPDSWRIRLLGILMGLALFIAAFQLRLVLSGAVSRRESTASLMLCVLGSLSPCALLLYLLVENGWPDWKLEPVMSVAILTCWLAASANLLAVVRYRERILRDTEAAISALMAGYFPNALLCLAAFWGRWQVGAYMVLLACGCYGSLIVARALKASAETRGATVG
jgi:hypothetical protein